MIDLSRATTSAGQENRMTVVKKLKLVDFGAALLMKKGGV